jgi:hypothetical protein
MSLSIDELRGLCDFAAHEQMVVGALQAALGSAAGRIRFFGNYTSWNGFFGSGVAALAGKIGRSRRLFLDPHEPITAIADRSVYVASFFFDAARDEFDDRETVWRDSHRCLAQATIGGLLDYEASSGAPMQPQAVNRLLVESIALQALNNRVALGYGVGTPDDLSSIFAGIGYHLGSELLADREFSIIDSMLRAAAPQLVAHLQAAKVRIAGQEHQAYQWVSIHSGHGGGAEADHFQWATQGARLALRFVPPPLHAQLRREVHRGFQSFASDHREFFTTVCNETAATP